MTENEEKRAGEVHSYLLAIAAFCLLGTIGCLYMVYGCIIDHGDHGGHWFWWLLGALGFLLMGLGLEKQARKLE